MKINIILLVLMIFAVSPMAEAVSPSPGGGYPGFNTAEGQNALSSLSTGLGNTGVGWFSLGNVTAASFNTGVGAGTLALNTADENTAVGAAALLLNSTGESNTAVGVLALSNNADGQDNTATGAQALFSNNGDPANNQGSNNSAFGYQALYSNTIGYANSAFGFGAVTSNSTGSFNTASGYYALSGPRQALGNGTVVTGDNNTAMGAEALESNTSGVSNSAFGSSALNQNATGNFNTAVGTPALLFSTGSRNAALGSGAGGQVLTANNVIIVGAGVSGISSVVGEIDDSCYIGNIFNKGVDAGTAQFVYVDQDGKLGTTALPNTGPLRNAQSLSGKVQELQATVAQQAKVIEGLTARLEEQATQIQKVSEANQMTRLAVQMVKWERD